MLSPASVVCVPVVGSWGVRTPAIVHLLWVVRIILGSGALRVPPIVWLVLPDVRVQVVLVLVFTHKVHSKIQCLSFTWVIIVVSTHIRNSSVILCGLCC
jgi:hypothetical protein